MMGHMRGKSGDGADATDGQKSKRERERERESRKCQVERVNFKPNHVACLLLPVELSLSYPLSY